MKARLFISLLLAMGLGGCAVGNTYDYRAALVGIPINGTANVDVKVSDQRPYVVSGKKPATFVGLQRGGYGNPFNVTTTSEAPLAEDLEVAISSVMTQRGFNIVDDQDASKDRTLELRLNEWKTDVMMRMKVLYDLVLTIYDASGTSLASHSINGEEVLGGGMQKQNSANAASTFEIKFTELLRDEEIRAALAE